MVKNLILSIIALAILAGCSGKKDKAADTSGRTRAGGTREGA